jgi:hypothetical protein
MAEVATRSARHRRAEQDLARARTVAKDAGMPLEDPAFFVSSGDDK